MTIFLDIGPMTIDFSTLISFLLGVSFGFTILLLIYLYAVLKSLNKGMHLRKADETDIDEVEIKWLIEDAQAQFKDKELRLEVGYGKHLQTLASELAIDIAKKFYPNSKYAYLELTVDESLKLAHYITDRIDDLLKGKILRLTRGITLAKIAEFSETKSKIDQNAIVKAAKKYSKVTKTAVAVINAVNPVYWFKKLTRETATHIIMIRIGLAIIAITGEETYKIYSKKVFNQDKQLDAGVDDIYNALTKDLEEAGGNDEETD